MTWNKTACSLFCGVFAQEHVTHTRAADCNHAPTESVCVNSSNSTWPSSICLWSRCLSAFHPPLWGASLRVYHSLAGHVHTHTRHTNIPVPHKLYGVVDVSSYRKSFLVFSERKHTKQTLFWTADPRSAGTTNTTAVCYTTPTKARLFSMLSLLLCDISVIVWMLYSIHTVVMLLLLSVRLKHIKS